MPLGKLGKLWRQHQRSIGRRRAQNHLSRYLAPGSSRQSLKPEHLISDPSADGRDPLPIGSQRQRSSTSIEQLQIQPLLQLSDAPRNRRMFGAEPPGGGS